MVENGWNYEGQGNGKCLICSGVLEGERRNGYIWLMTERAGLLLRRRALMDFMFARNENTSLGCLDYDDLARPPFIGSIGVYPLSMEELRYLLMVFRSTIFYIC
jgi:hypothetical protein